VVGGELERELRLDPVDLGVSKTRPELDLAGCSKASCRRAAGRYSIQHANNIRHPSVRSLLPHCPPVVAHGFIDASAMCGPAAK